MKIIDRRKSLETCTESGWDAVDLMMDEPMDDAWIEKMRNLEGSFLYMKMLKKPFFKVEYHDYVLKGIRGDSFFRMSFHRDSAQKVDMVVAFLNGK